MGSHQAQLHQLWRETWRLLNSPRLAAGLFLALTLCAALGTLLPQRPPQPDLSTWMELIQERYGGRASLYAGLGLFDIYRTPLFIALAGALSASTLVCTARRAVGLFRSTSIWRGTHRSPAVIQPDAFYRRLRCHVSLALSSVVQGLEATQPALRRHHYHIITARRGGIEYLYGERYGWARYATLVTHGAITVLVAALLLRGSMAWRELRVRLVPGQAYAVGHNTPWEVRLDRFSSRALGDGQPMEYRAHLTLLAEGQPVVRHQAKVNSPLSHRGLRVHLFSFGPAARVRAESQGRPVVLKPLGREEEGGEMFLPLSTRDRSQSLVIPSHNLQLHISPQLGAEGLFVEATQGEEGALVWSGPPPTGGWIESGDLRIQVRREAFVVVDLVHDPSFLPVIAGAALMVGGLSCTFAFPTSQLWARITPGEMWIAGRVSRGTLGFHHHFRRLAQVWRLSSSGREGIQALIELSIFCLLIAIACYALDLWGGGSWLRRLAVASSIGAVIILAAVLFRRALESRHPPFATTYEFALTFACSSTLIHLLWEWKGGAQGSGAFTLAPMLGLSFWAHFLLPPPAQQVQPLPPALRSVWFPLHVVPAALAYGAFALAGGAGTMLLLWPWLEGRTRASEPASVEALIGQGLTFGYPFLSAAIVIGMVWAQMAWGSYWSWDIKEVWTLVTWLFYTLLLHSRLLRGWRGRRMGWLALVGLGLVLFTFTGVGWLARRVGLESLHVY